MWAARVNLEVGSIQSGPFWIGVALALAGLVILATGVASGRRLRRFRRRASATSATVVSMHRSRGASDAATTMRTVYFPIVAFTTPDGREVTARTLVGSNPPAARRGHQVRVLYDPRDPQQVRIDSVLGRGGCLMPLLVALGGVMMLAGVVVAAVAA